MIAKPQVFTQNQLWLAGRTTLLTCLVGGLAVVLFLAWNASTTLLLAFPVILTALAAAAIMVAFPNVSLLAVIIGFVAIADNQAGFQAVELLYALLLYALLAHWYAVRILIRRDSIVHTPEDLALLLFLCLLPCSLVLTAAFGGSFRTAVSEMFSLSLLALYFPVRDLIAKRENGPKLVTLTVLALGILVAIRNSYEFAMDFSGATQAWQIADARVVTNDGLMMVCSLLAVVLLVSVKTWPQRMLLASSFLLIFAGLIITKSRGYWMAFALGYAAVFPIVGWQLRRRLVLASVTGLGLLALVGYLFLGPFMSLILEGLGGRIVSIGTALNNDLSLVNRFKEAGTVLQHIALNPIAGVGMGVSYQFYDIVHQATDYDSLVHNGYVGLWYKFGILGLGLLVFFWMALIRRGIQTYRQSRFHWARIAGLCGAAPLIAFTLSTISSTPFYLKDSLFIFSLMAGLSGGAWRYMKLRDRPEPAPLPVP